MRLEDLLYALLREGLSPVTLEGWTWGEGMAFLERCREAQRREYQARSLIAWNQAWLTAAFLAGERPRPVYELFPFWEEDEICRLRLERYRRLMEGLAGRHREEGKE